MTICKLLFNNYLVNDLTSKYWVYFTDISGQSFGTATAININDADDNPIKGYISGRTSIIHTFDYTGNTQGGRDPNTDAPFCAVAIGLGIAKYVLVTGTITNTTGETIINFTPDKDWNYSGSTQGGGTSGTSGTSGHDGYSGTDGTSGVQGSAIEIPLIGVQDNNNKIFTLSSGLTSLTHMFYLNGLLQTLNGDYIISGLTLAMVKAPLPTDILKLYGNVGYGGTSGTDGTSGTSGNGGTSGTDGLSGSSGTSGLSAIPIVEIPIIGIQNNINKIFTLSSGLTSLTHMIYKNGQLQTYGGDYIISGVTLFLLIAPAPGDILKLYGSIGAVGGTSGTSGISGINGTDGTSGSSGIMGIFYETIDFTIGENLIVITTGTTIYKKIDYDCIIIDWTLLSTLTGSCELDIRRTSYADYPIMSGITGNNYPFILNDIKNNSSVLTDWSINIFSGDILEFYLNSVTSITKLSVFIKTQRNS